MAEQKECPTCGAPLAPRASAAYCPRCLLTAGLEEAADKGAVDSATLESEDLLFCTVAVLLRRLDPGCVAGKFPDCLGGGSNGISEWLVEQGLLAPGEADTLRNVVSGILGLHAGDAESALDTLDPEGTIQTALLDPAAAAIFGAEGGTPMVVLSGQTHAGGISGVQEAPGRYSHLGEQGTGGMGRVLLVHDAVLGRDVALKELAPGMELDAGSPSTPVRRSMGFLSRFLQEARITGQLEHPSIVPVYELGYRPDRTLYYTMKLVRGKTLREAIEACETLQDRLGLLPHFIDLCQAIAYAHSRGVIHRDIKPENVMVGEFGETVVLDWGLAKSKNTEDVHAGGMAEAIRVLHTEGAKAAGQTEYGDVIGTPAFMSPEQAKGELEKVDERSDVYALGAVLYTILNNRPPYEGDSKEIVGQIAAGQSPAEPLPGTPPEITAILSKAMAPSPEHRYSSAQALGNEIQQFLTGGVISAYNYRFSEHLIRFVSRHKALLGVSTSAIVFLLFMTAIYTSQLAKSNRSLVEARDQAISAKEAESAERKKAELASEQEAIALKNAQETIEASYRSSIQMAASHLERGEYKLATDQLLGTPVANRNWEWGYLYSITDQSTLTLHGHAALVRSAAFSPDGNLIVTSSYDGTAKIWDSVGGNEIVTLFSGTPNVGNWAFSPDGLRIATLSSDNSCLVWDCRTGRRILTLRGHQDLLQDVSYSPNGKYILTASVDRTARIWDSETGEEVMTLAGHESGVRSAIFNADATRVITRPNAVDNKIRLWDAKTGKVIFTLPNLGSRFSGAVFNPHGTQILTTSADGTAILWDARKGSELFRLSGHGAAISDAWFSPDGKHMVTASNDTIAKVYDALDGKALFVLKGHTDTIESAVFSADATRIVTGSTDNTAKVWNAETGLLLLTLRGHDGVVRDASFSPDGTRVVTASEDGTAKVWNINAREDRGIVEGTPVYKKVWDKTAKVWNVVRVSDDEIITKGGSEFESYGVRISPDHKSLLIGYWNGEAKIWDIQSGDMRLSVQGHSEVVTSVNFNSDASRLLTASWDRTAKVWDVGSGDLLFTLAGHLSGLYEAIYSPDDTLIATVSVDKTAILWDAATGNQVSTLSGHTDALSGLPVFSPDGRLLATASGDGTARIWDVENGKELHVLAGHGNVGIQGTAFSPDGSRVITYAADGKVIVWDVKSGSELCALYGHSNKRVNFSPDGVAVREESFFRSDCKEWRALPWDPATYQNEENIRSVLTAALNRRPTVVDVSKNGGQSEYKEFVDALSALRDSLMNSGSSLSKFNSYDAQGMGVAVEDTEVLTPLGLPRLSDGRSVIRSINGTITGSASKAGEVLDDFKKTVENDKEQNQTLVFCVLNGYEHNDFVLKVGFVFEQKSPEAAEVDESPEVQENTDISDSALKVIEENERLVVEELKAIVAAETNYFADHGRYGTWADLNSGATPYLDGERWYETTDSYMFRLNNSPVSFSIVVYANDYGVTGRRSFFVDQSGVIRYDDEKDADLSSKVLE